MVMFSLSHLDHKYTFGANFVQIINIASLIRNLVPKLI